MPYRDTLRSLDEDRSPFAISGTLLGAALLGLWLWWFFTGAVELVEVSAAARVEATSPAHVLNAESAGRVATVAVSLGDLVRAGDLVIALDARAQRLAAEEARVSIAGLERELELLDRELAGSGGFESGLQLVNGASKQAVRGRWQEAQALVGAAQLEVKSLESVVGAGLVPTLELARARSVLAQREAALRALGGELSKLDRALDVELLEQRAKFDRLRLERQRVAGGAEAARAQLRTLELEISRARVTAPVDGTVAALEASLAGRFVRPGDALATVVPSGRHKVVAQFAADAAMGRLRAGQRAKVRLHAFPWTQFGSLDAEVTVVAGEVVEQRVRVELTAEPNPDIPLSHGLPGVVEVAVEHISPATLVLRRLGRFTTPTDQGAQP